MNELMGEAGAAVPRVFGAAEADADGVPGGVINGNSPVDATSKSATARQSLHHGAAGWTCAPVMRLSCE